MTPSAESADHRPGVCNIGPEEIARRRLIGHLGLIGTVLTWLGLLAVDAPRYAQLLVALPAAGSAAGYLQAQLKFCAAFGSLGIYNFGARRDAATITDDGARALDLARAVQIGLASAAIGALVGAAAFLRRR